MARTTKEPTTIVQSVELAPLVTDRPVVVAVAIAFVSAVRATSTSADFRVALDGVSGSCSPRAQLGLAVAASPSARLNKIKYFDETSRMRVITKTLRNR